MHSKISFSREVEEEIRSILRRNRKVEAVKRVRTLSGAGLQEAKAFVEGLARGMDLEGDQGFPAQLSFAEIQSEFEGELRSLLLSKRKVQAIKRVRELSGKGLKEAKDFIDQYEKDMQ